METFNLSAATAFGIESVAKKEIFQLGLGDCKAENGRLMLQGGWDTIASLNINCRTVERVYIVAGVFSATTFDELFDFAKAVMWERFFSLDSQITVAAKSVDSKLFSLSAIQSIVKKAVVERLKQKYNQSEISETGDKFTLEAAIKNDKVTLSIDTSGVGLHKRGYRDLSVEAPIKETLAAAMVLLSNWNKDLLLIDPFCGSGTIVIEAALIGCNTPPNLNRSFAFADWKCCPKSVLTQMQEKARQLILPHKLKLCGFDKDSNAISIARHHASKAGVENNIHFQTQDVAILKSSASEGVIITNPPYGERLGENKTVLQLYQTFASVCKQLKGFSLNVITPHKSMERILNRTAAKKRKFFNANVECWYYTFRI